MQRARRLASTAVVAFLAVAGLSACQQEPDVAAYVGDTTISEDRVDGIYDQVRDELTAARDQAQSQNEASGASTEPVAPVKLPIKQQDVVNTLLTVDVLQRAAKAHNVQPAETPTIDQVAQARSYSPQWEYTKLYTDTYRLRTALIAAVKPATLTEADLRDVYQRLTSGGAADASTTFEQFQSGLSPENKTLLEQYVALRNDLEQVVAKAKVKLNPRYGAQQVTLLSAQSGEGKEVPLVVLSFGGGKGADTPFVTDVS